MNPERPLRGARKMLEFYGYWRCGRCGVRCKTLKEAEAHTQRHMELRNPDRYVPGSGPP